MSITPPVMVPSSSSEGQKVTSSMMHHMYPSTVVGATVRFSDINTSFTEGAGDAESKSVSESNNSSSNKPVDVKLRTDSIEASVDSIDENNSSDLLLSVSTSDDTVDSASGYSSCSSSVDNEYESSSEDV